MNNYPLSQDYDLLIDFLDSGFTIVAFLSDDIVKITKNEDGWISVGVRGMGYFDGTSESKFIYYCEKKRLGWIVPTHKC